MVAAVIRSTKHQPVAIWNDCFVVLWRQKWAVMKNIHSGHMKNVLICSDFRKIGSETVWGNIPLLYGIAIVTYMPSIILALSTRKTIF